MVKNIFQEVAEDLENFDEDGINDFFRYLSIPGFDFPEKLQDHIDALEVEKLRNELLLKKIKEKEHLKNPDKFKQFLRDNKIKVKFLKK